MTAEPCQRSRCLLLRSFGRAFARVLVAPLRMLGPLAFALPRRLVEGPQVTCELKFVRLTHVAHMRLALTDLSGKLPLRLPAHFRGVVSLIE